MFLFALEQLKNKLVEKNINNHLSTNNSKELSNSLKQTLPKASRQFIEWFVCFTNAEGCFIIIPYKIESMWDLDLL